ncbi:MAG: hypothetical protein UW54_C0010G0010 [Parcubacteria group bacterium GW2011_GWC1_44_26]|nr:MAG: hypothetical protein UW54_C0010G0010 [Parcubacteria group bacterium GW2011_GWC1_44_26]
MKNIKILVALVAIAGIIALVFYGSGKSKDGVISSEVNGKVYVAIEGSGEIAVLDAQTKKVLKRIDLSEDKNGMTVSYMPHNVQVAPDNKSVWVTANADDRNMKMSFRIISRAEASEGHDGEEISIGKSNDEVIVIDPFSDAIVKRIELGQELHLSHVALTPDSSYAIVASQEKGIIYKINTTSFAVEKDVATKQGAGPHGLRISPDGKTAYIAMLSGKSMGAAVQTGVTPDGKYALASVYDAKSLAVYDVASSKLNYIDLPKEAKGPVQIYPTPDSRFVYVADQGFYFDQPIGDTVYKIDLQEMKVVQAIKGGSAPHGVVVSKDGAFVYITNLKSDEKSFDFGTVSMANGKVNYSFKIRNNGDTPVKITKIYTSCMCTEATLVNGASRKGPFGMPGHNGFASKMNEVVKPGQEISIEVEVDPAAHGPQGTGPAKKVIYIETDSAITPTLKLELDINVIP